MHALSLKQPWAALLAHGRKTVEVRKWPTARRGRVLIHASRLPDERPEAWALVPPELAEAARLSGGVVGSGELVGCTAYRTVEAFTADAGRHLNPVSWFVPPVLYGFTFTGLAAQEFRPFPGWTRFFEVPDGLAVGGKPEPAPATGTGLLVSVRSAAEAEAAVAAGAALIDVKEPARGPLGCADAATVREVVAAVAGRVPVSAALGELTAGGGGTLLPPAAAVPGLAFVKWGLAGAARLEDAGGWRGLLARAWQTLASLGTGCVPVAAAYADWSAAGSPPPAEVCAFVAERGGAAFLLDTWAKDGATLLDRMTAAEVAELVRRCRAAGVVVALAGSLGLAQMAALREARPDWFAVRGAVCRGGERAAALDPEAVRFLARWLRAARGL